MIACQYNIFESREQTEYRSMCEHIDRLEESLNKVRKGQFAKIGANTKKIVELEERINIIEVGLCRK